MQKPKTYGYESQEQYQSTLEDSVTSYQNIAEKKQEQVTKLEEQLKSLKLENEMLRVKLKKIILRTAHQGKVHRMMSSFVRFLDNIKIQYPIVRKNKQ